MNDGEPIGEWIQRARGGDAEALQKLLQHYREFVRLVVRCRSRGRLQVRLDSSDLVQETFVRVVEKIHQFEGSTEEEWRAWLGRVAEREAINQLRHHLGAEKRALSRERPLAGGSGPSLTGSPRLDQWLAKTQSSPSMAAMRKERAALLAEALARLPEDHREVLILRNLQGLDFAEVALHLGRSPGAVRVLWVRALKKLREELVQSFQEDSQFRHG